VPQNAVKKRKRKTRGKERGKEKHQEKRTANARSVNAAECSKRSPILT
jgi:hypothetical protein